MDYWQAYQGQVQEPKVSGAPVAFDCKMSLEGTHTNWEEDQNDHEQTWITTKDTKQLQRDTEWLQKDTHGL